MSGICVRAFPPAKTALNWKQGEEIKRKWGKNAISSSLVHLGPSAKRRLAPTPCEILRLALQHVLCCCRRRKSARAHKNAGVVGARSGELEPVRRV